MTCVIFEQVLMCLYLNNFCCHLLSLDLAAGKFQSEHVNEEGGDKGPVIPLLMQNKPPVKIEEDKLNDLPFRPDEVRVKFIEVTTSMPSLSHSPEHT